jgi:predicted GIY-YIG superfamily endonuclease
MSQDVVKRLGTHLIGRGAEFTKRHGVKSAQIRCFVETLDEAKRIEQAWYRVIKSRGYTIRM